MTMDEDVSSVAAGAVRSTAKATELVIQMVVAKAYKVQLTPSPFPIPPPLMNQSAR